jgi:hypothetical protein
MKNETLAERWIRGFEEGTGRKADPEEVERIRGLADKADPDNPGILAIPVGPDTKWPTAEEYEQRRRNGLREAWSNLVERCRQAGEAEPDPALLAKWEASWPAFGETMLELIKVGRAWQEARHSGDPTTLPYEKEFRDGLATGTWDASSQLAMMKKWYVANRAEPK